MRPKHSNDQRKEPTSRQYISVPEGVELCVIGDVHEHSEQFFKAVDEIKPSWNRILVSIGDVFDKGWGIREAEKITDKLIDLKNRGCCYAIRGNHEVKLIKKNRRTEKFSEQLKWWSNQPLVLTFTFEKTRAIVNVIHAGVTPKMSDADLGHSIEVVYVRDVDEAGEMIPLTWKNIDGVDTLVKSKDGGCVWHEAYDGRLGYICSGHAAQKDGVPKFYNYSCNLDTGIYETGKLCCQWITDEGKLGKLVEVMGTPAKPELHVAY